MTARRVLFVQHGDYREAALRFQAGGTETYYAQRHSIDHVADMVRRGMHVTVLCVASDPYEEVLPSGVSTIGIPRSSDGLVDVEAVLGVIEREQATHVALRYPGRREIYACLELGVQLLPLLADSFNGRRLRDRARHWRLARALNHPDIHWIGNHNVNAARSLAAIGVKPDRIVPWDWPSMATPEQFPVKAGRNGHASMQLLYVGQLSEPKGVTDCIEATALLRRAGVSVELSLIGKGDTGKLELLARSLGIADAVHVIGAVPHREVLTRMAAHDAVLLASRHEYPEGLPMVMYDAFCSRTPLIASDHPMFRGRAVDGVNAVVFKAAQPESLATAVRRLIDDSALYARLSAESAKAWQRLQIPVKWADLVDRWLRDDEEDRAWLAAHSLGSGLYDA